jgi:hypothetical protein
MNVASGHSTPKHLKRNIITGITAIISLASLLLPFGAASADSYSSMRTARYGNTSYVSSSYSSRNNYSSHGYTSTSYNRGNNYATASSYHSSYTSSQYPHQRYTSYRWVYDPCLHRWVLIGYNSYCNRWEYCSSGQRYTSWQY